MAETTNPTGDQDQQTKPEGGEGGESQPTTIKVGEKEYTPQELQDMVGFTSKVREFEKKSGTDFDNLTSSWGKRGEEIGKLKKKVTEYEAEKLEEKTKAGEPLSEEELQKQTLEQAKKFGLVTRDDFDQYYMARRQAEKLLDDCKDLETEIDGKDGRPAFKIQEILDYMRETRIANPEKAYKLKYEEQIDRWKEEQLRGAKPKGLVTEQTSTAGGKEPPKVKVTKDNLYQVVSETLHGGKE